MKNSILIITDNTSCKFARRYSNKKNLQILTLGFPGIQLLNTSLYRSKDFVFNYEFFDVKQIKDKAQEIAIQYCLDAKRKYSIFMNGNRNLFSYDGISSWWFTEFSEMGSFRTDFVEKIYFLSLIKLVNTDKYDKIHLDIEDSDILKAIREYLIKHNLDFIFEKHKKSIYQNVKNELILFFWLLFRLKFITRQVIKLLIIKIFDIGFIPQPNKERVLFFSFYPSLWKKNEFGNYVFRIFNDIMNRSNSVIKANYLIYTLGIRSFLKTVLPDRTVFVNQRIIFLEKYLNVHDVLSLLSLKNLKNVINYLLVTKKRVKDNYYEFDITNIIINSINQSLIMDEFHQDLLLYKSIKELLNQVKIHGIVHASEFQCHEKAIWYASQGKCKSYAVQHSAIGKNWTNYYFNEGEIKRYSQTDGEIRMPMPDFYLTAGVYPYRVMLKNGIDEKMLKLVGAIRYDSLSTHIIMTKGNESHKNISMKDNDDFKILLLTNVDRPESLNMISNVLSILKRDYSFSFKSHPLNILDLEVAQLFQEHDYIDQLKIIPAEENYFDHIVNSNVVLFCNSTIGIESIALGVPSISFETYNSIKSYDIIEVGESLYRATNSHEIENAIESIRKNDDVLRKKMKTWKDTIFDTFYKLDGNSGNRLIDIIKSNLYNA
ncbi:MAG: hypothetical protein ISS28_05525 [Candidatus Cloacimonetes bacterium]|nr:hypothetical protein [Candidatus Cloacimonadota bacterium]